ncbi:OmpW family protein [Corticibacter populi]|uniref:OmpW family protein n=1 Tax=Corticibacter populi TaxID=1550736 RepID=A0A3M6QPN8_9BURK|nr:OmpW family protein [Corticibacter populi]RMX05006.1 OmpW family protein [Corticibacter populi]RZS33563.1 outer membrane protein [Corticibacter populi]
MAARHFATCCLIATGMLAASPVLAHQTGDVLLKFGLTHVKPKSDNGSVAGNSIDLDVGSSTRPSFSLTYLATDNIGIELLGALPFKHSVHGSTAAGALGQIGETKQLPPTLSLQWHFLPQSTIQPYVGLGVNYTRFFSTKARGPLAGSRLKLDDSWGLAGQLGVDIKIDDKWFFTTDVRYIDISSDVKLNGEKIGKAKIDPWTLSVGVGYRF